jgi:uncharacterized OsmC-like protein
MGARATAGHQAVGRIVAPGRAELSVEGTTFAVDCSDDPGRGPPGPVELLAAAVAACLLADVERYSRILPFHQTGATAEVTAWRGTGPLRVARIEYVVRLRTDEPERRLALLHRNLRRHGDVLATLSPACQVTGELVAEADGEA